MQGEPIEKFVFAFAATIGNAQLVERSIDKLLRILGTNAGNRGGGARAGIFRRSGRVEELPKAIVTNLADDAFNLAALLVTDIAIGTHQGSNERR